MAEKESKGISDLFKLGKLVKQVMSGERDLMSMGLEAVMGGDSENREPLKADERCQFKLRDGSQCISKKGHDGCCCPSDEPCESCIFDA